MGGRCQQRDLRPPPCRQGGGAQGGRRGHHDAVQLRRLRELHPLRARSARLRRHRASVFEHGREPDRGRHHTPDKGDPPGSRVRSSVPDGRDLVDRATSSPARHRGRVRGAGGRVRWPEGGNVRGLRGVRLLPQQADDHRRRRRSRHGQRGVRQGLPEPAKPRSRRRWHVAQARAARL